MNLVDLVMASWMEGWNAALEALMMDDVDFGEDLIAALSESNVLRALSTLPNVVVTDSGAVIWIVNSTAPLNNPPKYIAIDHKHFLAVQGQDPREQASEQTIIDEVEQMQFKMYGGEVGEISPSDPDFN